MVGSTDQEIAAKIGALRGVDASGWDFLASTDQVETLRRDIALISSCALMPPGVQVGAFIFDVHSGELLPAAPLVDPPSGGPSAG